MDGELLTRCKASMYCTGRNNTTEKFIRNIKLREDEEERSWERFAILPNVNGQKYTIGNHYSSRKVQGEFISLEDDNYSDSDDEDTTEERECEIAIKNNKYFVTTKRGHPSVLINDVIVATRTELKFGDLLSLRNKNEDFDLNNKYEVYLFKERDLNLEAQKKKKDTPKKLSTNSEIFTGTFIAGQNELILSHIMSYLPAVDIKTARLVSKLWNEEGFKILRKRCVLNLNFGKYLNSNESMKLFQYAVEMKNRSMSNWRINFFYGMDSMPKQSRAKLLDDLNMFIFKDTADFRHIKRLGFGGCVKYNHQLFIKLLQVLGKELEEFNWAGDWYLSKKQNYSFPHIELTKLRVFTLSPDHWIYERSYEETDAKDLSRFSWLHYLIKMIQRVATLRLECHDASNTSSFLSFIHKNEYWKLLTNLNEISFHCINPDGIKILLKLDKPLQKLALGDLQGMKEEDFPNFDLLLSKHSQTLKTLELIVCNCPLNPTIGRLRPVFINFPRFPKLVTLKAFFGPHANESVTLSFPNGIINYKNDLPSLKSLTLWPMREFGMQYFDEEYLSIVNNWEPEYVWGHDRYLFEMFFPAIVRNYVGVIGICTTVQHLDVLHKVGLYSIPLFTKEAESVIAEMFPKVENNPWIDSIRDGSSVRARASAMRKKQAPVTKGTERNQSNTAASTSLG